MSIKGELAFNNIHQLQIMILLLYEVLDSKSVGTKVLLPNPQAHSVTLQRIIKFIKQFY